MGAATLAMKVTSASLTDNRSTSNSPIGTRSLTLIIESTASASAVPLSVAGTVVTSSDPRDAKAMLGKVLTLNYDDVTGVITSLT